LDDQDAFLLGPDLPDHGGGNPHPSVSQQQMGNRRAGGDDQQRTRGDQGQGVKLQRTAESKGFRQDRDFLLPYAQPYSPSLGDLRQAGKQATFGRVVHCVDLAGPYGKARIMNHTDAGVEEPSLGPPDGGAAHFLLQRHALCPRENCGAFYGYTPRQDYEVTGSLAFFSNKLRSFRLPQHLAHYDGTLQSGGDFRVASAQGNAERPASVEYIQENLLRQLQSGAAFRQEQRCQEPTRPSAERGDVVGVDIDGVPAD